MVKQIFRLVYQNRVSISIYVTFLLVTAILFVNKTNMHIDEMLSYTLANNEGIVMDFEENKTYVPAEQVYLQNLVVNNAFEQFNFATVWKNQTNDVHPPLYYLILHIICSYNAGKFNIWYAAIINIFLGILTLHVLRKFMYLFISDKVIVEFCSILYILSPGILQNVSFLRMYVLAMFWVTLTAYLFVRLHEEKVSWKLWLQIGFVAIAGALTHYYCIIYLCATCLIVGICMLIERRWKDILTLFACMAVSAVMSVSVFPAMVQHMFSGYRGTESIENLTKGTGAEYWERIKSFYGFMNDQTCGGILGGILLLALGFLLFVVIDKKRNIAVIVSDKRAYIKWIIVGIPILIYFIFVSESAVYVTNRYLFPVYAVVFGILMCVAASILGKTTELKCKYAAICLIGTLFVVNGFKNAHWEYLYKASADFLDKVKIYSDRNCISVYDIKWKEQPAFYEMKNYKSVTFISQNNIDSIMQYGDLFEDGFILTVIGGNDDEIITKIQK